MCIRDRNSVEKYEVKQDKWTQMAVMKDKRHYLSACTINDEFIYAFGGFFGSTEQEINDTIEVYDVDKNTWVVLTVRMKVSKTALDTTHSIRIVLTFRTHF